MARRTEVTVDLVIGRVTFRGGRVAIPATADGGGGGGTSGGSGGGSGGGGGGALADIFGAAGAFRLRQQLAALESLFAGVRGAGVLTGATLVGVFAAVAGAVIGVIGWLKLLQVGLQLVGTLGKAWLLGLWNATKTLAGGFWSLGQAIMQGTVNALQAFVQAVGRVVSATVQGMQQALGAVWQFTQNAVAAFSDFQQQIANTTAVMGVFGNAGLAMREGLMDFATNVATKSRYAATEVAKALYEIGSAGYSSAQDLKVLTQAAIDLAGATLSDLTPTAGVLMSTLAAFGLGVQYAGQAADMFAQAINKSFATLPKLIESMKYIGPVAHQANIGLRETIALLEGLYKQGMSGSMAGTYLRQSLVMLSRETKAATVAFKKYGSTLSEFNPVRAGGVVSLIGKFEELKQKIGQTNLTLMLMQAFGTRGSQAILALINVGTKQLGKFYGELAEQGIAARTAADQLNTLAGAWLQIKNLWQNIYIETMRGGLNVGVAALLNLLRDLEKQALNLGVFRRFGAMLALIADEISGVAEVIGPVLLAAFDQVVSWLPQVADGIGTALGEIVPTVVDTFNQLVPIVADVFLGLVDLLPWLARSVTNTLGAIMPALRVFLNGLPTLIGSALGKLIPALLGALTTGLPVLINFIAAILPRLAEVFVAFATVVTGFLQANGGNLVTWFSLVLDGVLQIVQWLPQLIPTFTTLFGMLITMGQGLKDNALTAFLNTLREAIVTLVPVLMNLATTVFPVVVNLITQLGTLLAGPASGALQAYAGLIYQVLYLLGVNWPAIMNLANIALYLLRIGLGMTRVAVADLLPRIQNLLSYLGQNWQSIVGSAAKVLTWLIDGLVGVVSWLATLEPAVGGVIVVFQTLTTIVDGLVTAVMALAKVFLAPFDASSWKAAEQLLKDFGNRTGNQWKAVKAAAQAGEEFRRSAPEAARRFGDEAKWRIRSAANEAGAPQFTPTVKVDSDSPLRTENLSYSRGAVGSMTEAVRLGTSAGMMAPLTGVMGRQIGRLVEAIQPIIDNGGAALTVSRAQLDALGSISQIMPGLATCAQLSARTNEIVGSVRGLLPVLERQYAAQGLQLALAQLAPWFHGGRQFSMTEVIPLMRKQWSLMGMDQAGLVPMKLPSLIATQVKSARPFPTAPMTAFNWQKPQPPAPPAEIHTHVHFDPGVTQVVKSIFAAQNKDLLTRARVGAAGPQRSLVSP